MEPRDADETWGKLGGEVVPGPVIAPVEAAGRGWLLFLTLALVVPDRGFSQTLEVRPERRGFEPAQPVSVRSAAGLQFARAMPGRPRTGEALNGPHLP